MGLLSDDAGDLYARLVSADGLPLGDLPGQVPADDRALAELCRHGLARTSPDCAVHPVSPDLALGKLLVRRQRQLLDDHDALLADYERLARMARASGRGEHVASPYLETLASSARVQAVQRDLQCGALDDYRALEMPWLAPPSAAPAGMRRRLLCTAALLPTAVPAAVSFAGTGEECRVLDPAPIRLIVADDLALVLLTATGTGAAVLVRAPVVVAALSDYFDLLWDRATPVGGPAMASNGARPLPRSERVLLGMLMAGLTDAAIARNLGISARTVRRQVAALEERAGVSTRFALGAAAVRLGWVGG
jgi:DNA-binding CsgD family transcriptional regulator